MLLIVSFCECFYLLDWLVFICMHSGRDKLDHLHTKHFENPCKKRKRHSWEDMEKKKKKNQGRTSL
jgi:hypothetical protein